MQLSIKRSSHSIRTLLIATVICAGSLQPAQAERALVAVATNFMPTVGPIRERFEAANGHEIRLTSGATGKLFAQISHGAPYDVLLAADQAWPIRLESNKHAVAGSRFTYAVGRVCLWRGDRTSNPDELVARLRSGNWRKLALANPALAPYGIAAEETLRSLGLFTSFKSRLVFGENVGQAHAMVASGNAELGFTACTSVASKRNAPALGYWLVPSDLHAPIRQDAVLLQHGKANVAAVEFLTYLRAEAAREIIARHGYELE